MSPSRVDTSVTELAAAELDLDRLLTSFEVNYWRARDPLSGLTAGHRVAHQTRLNVAARRALFHRAFVEDLGEVRLPAPATIVQRPAEVLRRWRRSCSLLRSALTTAASCAPQGWLRHRVETLHELELELAAHHASWSERSARRTQYGRRAG